MPTQTPKAPSRRALPLLWVSLALVLALTAACGGEQNIVGGLDEFEANEILVVLHAKGIGHWLDVWGHDVNHDWPWWHKAMPIYVNRLF